MPEVKVIRASPTTSSVTDDTGRPVALTTLSGRRVVRSYKRGQRIEVQVEGHPGWLTFQNSEAYETSITRSRVRKP